MTAALRPRMRTLLSFCSFVILYSLFVISASASAEAAGLSGRVTDPDGRAVANAEVIVTGTAAAPLRARSDSEGRFSIAGLAAGRYRVTASAPGLVSDPAWPQWPSAP